MSTLLQWFTSPEWAQVVKALLHSVWQGALIALILAIVLRRLGNPAARYRSSLAALVAMLFATIITWAVINAPAHHPAGAPAGRALTQSSVPMSVAPSEPNPSAEPVVGLVRNAPATRWTAWLACIWFLGALLMLTRAGFKVLGAEKLRRSCRPLDDSRIETLVAETRRALGIANRIRIGVTDKLTSPAVVGIVVPMLILPLALLTTLTPEQIRFVLLHELAHIRRRDYLANLFQFFAESLLFFNPAVWWISHQIRREREACCDALATELSGAPADYAQTLVQVAEKILYPAPAAATAFGNKSEPSSLAERIQRLLVPGYRPSLRLTWRAMLTALVFGSVLLFLSAIGTRLTVAAVLEPQNLNKWLSVTAHFRTADGSPLPETNNVDILSQTKGKNGIETGLYGGKITPEGALKSSCQRGTIWLAAEADGFAPTVVGPLDGHGKNLLDAGELTLDRGFDVPIQVSDSKTGTAVANATLRIEFWWPNKNEHGGDVLQTRYLKTDSKGEAGLSHCANLPLTITINAPGYEISEYPFKGVRADKTMNIPAKTGAHMSGIVTDQATGQPVAGAMVRLICDKSHDEEWYYEWNDPDRVLATTGADGRFVANQLRQGLSYHLGISAPEHEAIVVSNLVSDEVKPDQKLHPLIIQLKPGHRIAGRLIEAGTTNLIAGAKIWAMGSDGTSVPATEPAALTDAGGHFEFTELGSESYTLQVEGGDPTSQQLYRGDIDTNITLAVKLFSCSALTPKAPLTNSDSGTAATNLQTRLFNVDSNTLYRLSLSDGKPSIADTLVHFDWYVLSSGKSPTNRNTPFLEFPAPGKLAGLQLDAPKGVMYSPGSDRLTVYATAADLAAIQTALGQSADQLVQDGKLLYQLGKRDEAKTTLTEALNRDPDNRAARYYLSLIKRERTMDANNSNSTNLYTRRFKLDQNTFYMGLQNLGLISSPAPSTRAVASTNHGPRFLSAIVSSDPTPGIRTAFTNLFTDIGVTLLPPKSVFYDDYQFTLTVHATTADLNLIEAALNTLNTAPPEVEVQARFVEVNQGSNWPQKFGWFPKGTTNNDQNFSAILTDPQFRVVLGALAQRDGADLLNEGSVTTLSGRQAQFQIMDELAGTNTVITNGQGQSIRYAYDTNTEPAGVFLDVQPEITADESAVQLALIATVREFTGYARGPVLDGVHHMVPTYREVTFTNNCTLGDGQTVVFGGLMTNDTVRMRDKVPFLGDLPVVGRLFTSNSTRILRNNMIIFVTPILIDAAGKRTNPSDAESPFPPVALGNH